MNSDEDGDDIKMMSTKERESKLSLIFIAFSIQSGIRKWRSSKIMKQMVRIMQNANANVSKEMRDKTTIKEMHNKEWKHLKVSERLTDNIRENPKMIQCFCIRQVSRDLLFSSSAKGPPPSFNQSLYPSLPSCLGNIKTTQIRE